MLAPVNPPVLVAKDKEEMSSESVARSDGPPGLVMDDESDEEGEIPEVVQTAEQAVPVVTEKGTKAPQKAGPRVKKTADRKPKVEAKPFDKNRPDLWEAPKNATPERLADGASCGPRLQRNLASNS